MKIIIQCASAFIGMMKGWVLKNSKPYFEELEAHMSLFFMNCPLIQFIYSFFKWTTVE